MVEQLTYFYGRKLDSTSVTAARKRFKDKFGYSPTTVFFHREEMPENVVVMAGLEVKAADWPLLRYHFALTRVDE